MGMHGIRVTEDTLDLIQFLNGGVRPRIEEKPSFFVFDTDGTKITSDIVTEDVLRQMPVSDILFP